jgi:large subunit ribosomal protein L18
MPSSTIIKQRRRQRRKTGIRKGVFGTPERPRLTVYRSLKHVYAQIVDDLAGRTLAAASSPAAHIAKGGNKTAAAEVGKLLAQKAKDAGITQVAFDRNGFKYHGRVKALADAARQAGLKF